MTEHSGSLHVLFFTFHLPGPTEPGAARPWEELQLMRELGYRVTAVTASTHYLTEAIDHPVRGLWRKDIENGVTIIRTWSPSGYRRSLLRRLGCYVAYSALAPLAAAGARRVDAVFTATDPPFMTPGAYVSSLFHRARLVLDERDIYPETLIWLGVNLPAPVVRLWSWWSAWLRQRATSVITVSPGFVRILADRGAHPGKTFLITNYFPHDDSESMSVKQPKGRIERESGEMVVLYAGGLGHAAEVGVILETALILKERGDSSIRFVILGAGERQEEYVRYRDDRGLLAVEFWGVKPRSEMSNVYANIDVAVHALGPQWRNSLSSKIFEYMGHGRPVVFAGEGDIADILRESGGGITVASGDAMSMADALAMLATDSARRVDMGKRAADYIHLRFNRRRIREEFGRALSSG